MRGVRSQARFVRSATRAGVDGLLLLRASRRADLARSARSLGNPARFGRRRMGRRRPRWTIHPGVGRRSATPAGATFFRLLRARPDTLIGTNLAAERPWKVELALLATPFIRCWWHFPSVP